MADVAYFDLDRQLVEARREEAKSRLEPMNAAAENAVGAGGNCDDLTFMTAFLGGFLNSRVNWGTPYCNELLIAHRVSKRVKKAFGLQPTIAASVGEPYLSRPYYIDSIDQTGLVLPASPNYGFGGVEYSIQQKGTKVHPSYIGRMTFNVFQAGRLYKREPEPRIGQEVMLELERQKDSGSMKILRDSRQIIVGTAAVRQSFNAGEDYNGYNPELEAHLLLLRETVAPYLAEIITQK